MKLTEIPQSLVTLHGWGTPEKANVIIDTIISLNAKICIEIGVFGGRTLIPMGAACRQLGDAIAIGFDPYTVEAASEHESEANASWSKGVNYQGIHQHALTAIAERGLNGHCVIIPQRAELWKGRFECIDFLHIDGNHSEEHSTADVQNFVPFVRPGGIVMFDDTDWASTKRAQEMLDDLCVKRGMVGTTAIFERKDAL